MKYIFALCLILVFDISLTMCSNEGKVIVLTKENFHKVLQENDFVLVEFYAPKCGACIALEPQYNKAAEMMYQKQNTIKLAKVDAMEEPEIAKEYAIDGYPIIRYFRKGLTTLDYKNLRNAESIVSWAIKRSGPEAVILKTPEEAKQLLRDNKVVTIGFFEEDSDKAKTYLSAAEISEDSVFAITFEKTIFKHFKAESGSIIVFNKEYENEVVFNKEFTKDEIAKFVEIRSLPLIMEYTSDNSLHLFAGYIKTHILLFLSKSDASTKEKLENVKEVAQDFKEELLFIFFDIDIPEHIPLFQYLGVQLEDPLPAVRLINFNNRVNRYKPRNPELSPNNIRHFLKEYKDGILKRILLSEPLPDDWNQEPVYELVGNNFESVVTDKTKHVLVEFYAPRCPICKNFTQTYDLIGEYYNAREDIVIAKIDATRNEFEHRLISGTPTITLYTKTNEAIDYIGKLEYDSIIKFIESGGKIQEKEELEENESQSVEENEQLKKENINDNKHIPEKEEL